ncbi:uncharacterized protein LOC130825724 isoform X2 [Amaranthus tricolor]|uniref:uncharacterized protein LOC130825724 isoform X2 n=1 Tax=Amaranthus tricolor TaxID=29722 RepID=UPI00258A23D8|nr:uncharacterized protein LOC130825724 isoform X2 [Amaranthus tricolor]
MEEYLQYMRTLRSQMNDYEDQTAKISVDEQMLITTIHTLEKDLDSAKTETKRVVEETDEMIKNKAELLSRIFEKQKRNVSLEADSFNLLQTLELIQQEKSNQAAKVLEKRIYYSKVIEDMKSKLQEQKVVFGQDWLDNNLSNEPSKDDIMEKKLIEEMSSKGPTSCSSGDENKTLLLGKVRAAQSKLDETIHAKNKLISENNELKQSIEQLKSDINDIKPELIATEVSSLEKELKVLLSEKDGELEYLKSLRSQIDKLKGIRHLVKCACGTEYKIELSHCDVEE